MRPRREGTEVVNDPVHVAIHEAGHAVAAAVLGLEPRGVTARPDDTSAGHCLIPDYHEIWAAWEERGKYRDLDSVIRGRIIAMMAGVEAELEILGLCVGGDGDDRRRVHHMLDDLVPKTPDGDDSFREIAERFRRSTRRIVRRHRDAIIRLAQRLEHADFVPPDGIYEAIRNDFSDHAQRL